MGSESQPHFNYFAVESTEAVVESAATVAVSACTAVESVVSVAVDPEPHAASVNITPSAKINVTFFI
jgi:hypothetical protein